jgi:hypothetical protein
MCHAAEELQRLEMAFDRVKKQLLGRMHDIVRQQLQLPEAGEPHPGSPGSQSPPSPQQQQQQQRLLSAVGQPPVLDFGGRGGAGSSSSAGEAVQVEVLAPEQQR